MVFHRLWRSFPPGALRSLLSNRPHLSSGRYGTGYSSPRSDALAGSSIVTHNQYEDHDGEKRMNKPTQHRGNDVEHDANTRSQYLRSKEGRWQIRLHQFGVAIQMRKETTRPTLVRLSRRTILWPLSDPRVHLRGMHSRVRPSETEIKAAVPMMPRLIQLRVKATLQRRSNT
jgi:hypothetical protein